MDFYLKKERLIRGDPMYTLAITNQDLVYFVVLTLCTYTTWLMGLRTGGMRTVDYLIEQGQLEVAEE